MPLPTWGCCYTAPALPTWPTATPRGVRYGEGDPSSAPRTSARYLRRHAHADERLVRLVAHHSCAVCEAHQRGLAEKLTADFDYENPELVDTLIYPT